VVQAVAEEVVQAQQASQVAQLQCRQEVFSLHSPEVLRQEQWLHPVAQGQMAFELYPICYISMVELVGAAQALLQEPVEPVEKVVTDAVAEVVVQQ
jgi:hypothetical protein